MWKRKIDKEVASSFGHDQVWKAAEDAVRDSRALNHGVKKKNPVLIAATLEELARQGHHSSELDRLCDSILQFARGQTRPPHALGAAAS